MSPPASQDPFNGPLYAIDYIADQSSHPTNGSDEMGYLPGEHVNLNANTTAKYVRVSLYVRFLVCLFWRRFLTFLSESKIHCWGFLVTPS